MRRSINLPPCNSSDFVSVLKTPRSRIPEGGFIHFPRTALRRGGGGGDRLILQPPYPRTIVTPSLGVLRLPSPVRQTAPYDKASLPHGADANGPVPASARAAAQGRRYGSPFLLGWAEKKRVTKNAPSIQYRRGGGRRFGALQNLL